jgi:hypothetical protein
VNVQRETPAELADRLHAEKDAADKKEAADQKRADEAAKQSACQVSGKIWNPEDKSCANKPAENSRQFDCGDFSFLRFTSSPFGWLKDLLIPCQTFPELFNQLITAFGGKFPFSLAASLNGAFDSAGGGGEPVLPSRLWIIPLDFGSFTTLWAIIKSVVGVSMWAYLIYWIIDRFTPSTRI